MTKKRTKYDRPSKRKPAQKRPDYFGNEAVVFIEIDPSVPLKLSQAEHAALAELGTHQDALLENIVSTFAFGPNQQLVVAKVTYPTDPCAPPSFESQQALIAKVRAANQRLIDAEARKGTGKGEATEGEERSPHRRAEEMATEPTVRPKQNGMSVKLISPNWYAGALPSTQVPSGGPAEWPESVSPDDLPANASPTVKVPSLHHFEHDHERHSGHSPVDVFILDAFPDQSFVEQKLFTLPTGHDLIELCQSGRLKWYSRSNPIAGVAKIDMPSPTDVQLPDHNYDMSDHGLFVAGIIHSIAPTAKLHLIPILNTFGVGCLLSFAQGLEVFYKAIQDRSAKQERRPFIINLSLEYGLPSQYLQGIPLDDPEVVKDWRNFLGTQSTSDDLVAEVRAFVDATNQGTNILIDMLHMATRNWADQDGTVIPPGYIVAAAGNDAQPTYPRPAPSYPANNPQVISVAALKKLPKDGEFVAADYSNLPTGSSPVITDHPIPPKGIWTFGGEYKDDKDEDAGILGVSSIERLGYAWWAGTSFATAVVSGTLAELYALNPNTDAKDTLFAMAPVMPITDAPDGPVLYATQP